MHALVTGASGFLGYTLVEQLLAAGHRVTGTSQDGEGLPAGAQPLELSLDDGGLRAGAELRVLRPDWVFHLAAESNADRCAEDAERAVLINTAASGNLAAAAAELDVPFVFSSSDLVFSGAEAPYREDDPPGPLGPYMASKAAAEQLITLNHPGACVARVALLYGPQRGRHGSFTQTLVERLGRGESVPCFTDQFRTPVLTADAATCLIALADQGARGIVHLGGPERVSRHAHALAIAAAGGFEPSLCRESEVADVAGLSPRPRDASLVIERLVELTGITPRGVAEGAQAVFA